MELLRQVSNTQLLYPVAAVAVVLICATLVFIFGFHSAEQPQFDKLPLVVDDRKSANKKRKGKDKKSSPNRTSNEDAKTKTEVKKSPSKEKKEEKPKEAEKPKPKEKPVEAKAVKKDTVEVKKNKKGKNADVEKPVDFDDGEWEEVPKKSEKKKTKPSEDKKESPVKKNKLKGKNVEKEVETAPPAADIQGKVKPKKIQGPIVDEEADRALQAQIEEVQRILKEAERREQAVLSGNPIDDAEDEEDLTEVKDLRSNKKIENKEKQKKKAVENVSAKVGAKEPVENDNFEPTEKQNDAPSGPVFDEIGDAWIDTKAPKKGKKKARKE